MQGLVRHIKLMPLLMALTILGIAGFQYYWLNKAYDREKRTLEMRSNITFRETVRSLQAAKLKLDKLPFDTGASAKVVISKDKPLRLQFRNDDKMIGLVHEINERMLREKRKDSSKNLATATAPGVIKGDSIQNEQKKRFGRREKLIQFLYEVDSPQDSVRVSEIYPELSNRLEQQSISVPFEIERQQGNKDDEAFNKVSVGFKSPVTYILRLEQIFPFLIKKLLGPIMMSLFLVLFAIVSFSLLFRTLIRQRRLADIKNEFISNITHELRTPIATVSVAIEALRTFNASLDQQKTKEYLDISANELQRLSMLVDKVLKLSMFEKREVELKYETMDMKELVQEVISSLRLQFEKQHALVSTSFEGETTLSGDRLHLVSVIFNLIDNALKYGGENPTIDVSVKEAGTKVVLAFTDNGVGVPEEYRERIFEKFFRVPTGNIHNAKGYGLGLSYVSHVVKKHNGTIKVEPMAGGGSSFIVTLPKTNA